MGDCLVDLELPEGSLSIKEIEAIFVPETPLEGRLLADPELIYGLNSGEPRSGHPEGKIIYHVRDVLSNIDKFGFYQRRQLLRFIGITHDSFKFKVDQNKPKVGDNNHGMIARRFAEGYTRNKGVLEVIELHDEPYFAWRDFDQQRAERLIERLGTNLDLFLEFYKCDNSVDGKSDRQLDWFCELVGRRV